MKNKIYCGSDHCTGLWNIPCDDPNHPKPPEGVSVWIEVGHQQALREVEKLITEEINIAHSENQPTSRLTSLYMKIDNIKKKI